MYNKLSLKNFRGFKDFTMELKPVTLIAGQNNTGKTSVLESIFLLQNYTDKNVFLKLRSFREPAINIADLLTSKLTPNNTWQSLFYDMNIEEQLEIKLGDKFFIQLKKGYESPYPVQNRAEIEQNIYTQEKLDFQFEKDDYTSRGGYYIANTSYVGFFWSQVIDTRLKLEHLQYLSSNAVLTDEEVSESFSNLEFIDNKQKIIDILKIFGDDITDIIIRIMDSRMQLYVTKQNKKIPISVMGDGIRKVLHIALTLLVNPGCILLIDEVENGLHYSLFPKLWEIIAKLAVENNCQVIATTHSYECIVGATEGVKNDNLRDNFILSRLDKEEGTIRATTYDIDSLEYAIETGWEVR